MKREISGRGLRWLGFALGLADIAAARFASQAVGEQRSRIVDKFAIRRDLLSKLGLKSGTGVLGKFGVREVKTGLGILSRQRKAPWLWARVAGDVLDLFALGSAFATKKRRRGRIGAALAAIAGLTALDIMYGRRMTRSH